MPGISYFLNRVQELCKTIDKLQFQSPGIFTNSFIAEPSITTLLKDAEEFELALYRVRKRTFSDLGKMDGSGLQLESKPERLDGNSIYKEHSFNEFTGDNDNEKGRKRIAVRVPQLSQRSLDSSSLNTDEKHSSPTKIINLPDSKDVKEVINATLDLVAKYPHLVSLEEGETIVAYHEKYKSLLIDIEELGKKVNEQKELLAMHNVSLSDAVLLSSPLKQRSDEVPNYDIDELIRQEELEIETLEKQLDAQNEG